MAKNYRHLTESIRSRINLDNIAIQKAFYNELSSLFKLKNSRFTLIAQVNNSGLLSNKNI